jgi:hypothetical protein
MKHVKLFESWDPTDPNSKMTSEHFQKLVNAAVRTKSPADAARLIKTIIDQNPYLKNDVENMRALGVMVKTLTGDDKEMLKNEFDPVGAEKRNQAAAAKQEKLKAASDLLDSFESGEIEREEFISKIAGIS